MLKYAWREILRRKNRSFSAILSYTLAVLLFTLLVSLLTDSDNSMSETLRNTGTHFIAFKPVCCNVTQIKDGSNEGFWANGTRSAIIPMEILSEIKKLPSVKDASPMLMFLFRDSIRQSNFTVAGFFPENKISVANTTCASTDIVEGRYITSDDTNYVMIEHSYSISHKLGVGDTLRVAGRIFWVKAVINAGIRPVKADVYMPFVQAEHVISKRTWSPLENQMNLILVESANADVHNKAVQGVKTLLGRDNIVSSYSCYKPAASAMDLNRNTLLLASILITIFIIMHVFRNQYASFVERKHEIGILHSIGWQTTKIVSYLSYELFIQTVFGGILGTAFAAIYKLVFPTIPTTSTYFLLMDSLRVSMIGFGLMLCVSIFSVVFIMKNVTSVPPMENLRTP